MEKLKENYAEFVNEFTDDGSIYQLAGGKSFNKVWSKEIHIDGKGIVTITGGWTNVENNVHTAVVYVVVDPKLNKDGAEDQAVESITIYFKDWTNPEEARKDVMRFANTVKMK